MLTDKDLDILYQAVCHDTCFPPKRATFDKVLERSEMLEVKAKKSIVEYSSVDTSIWIVAKGMTRLTYYSDNKEVTYGFGAQGTMFCSPLGFIKGEEANFHLIAVSDVIMFRLSKTDFVDMITTDIDISNWFFGAVLGQMMASEIKVNIHGYPTEETVERFIRGLMEEDYKVINKDMRFNRLQLPMRVLASYFGITRAHMAHIVKKVYEKGSDLDNVPKIEYDGNDEE
ncbi:MAG: Crp/Fnr family transcriptional regulator [Muribaculaceae bacterium]|nr:Crp/Fnr family transcriptional regulator [Muribaculaceae bacterium]